MNRDKVFKQLKSIFYLSKEEVLEQFGADLYRYFRKYFKNPGLLAGYLEKCKRIVEITRGKEKVFLDLGAGYGLMSICLLIAGAKEVIVVEINEEKVNTMKKILESNIDLADRISVYREDFSDITMRGEQIDIIVANEVINHVPELKKVLKKAYDILNPNGILYISESSNVFYLPLFLQFRKHWKIMEYGPESIKVQKDSSSEPYYEMRRTFIKDNFPSLNSHQINKMSFKTKGLKYDEIRSLVDGYFKTGKFKRARISIRWCKEPVCGIYNEKLINPLSLRRDIERIGFEVKLTLTLHKIVSTGIAGIIKNIVKFFANKFWVFLTPRIELMAYKNNRTQ